MRIMIYMTFQCVILLLLSFLQLFITFFSFPFFYISAKCKNALGMESGAIADFQITASSAHDIGNVGPQHAR